MGLSTKRTVAATLGEAQQLAAGAARVVDAEMDSMIGALLKDKYLVSGLLAEGGMGRVYLAQNTALKRAVAVKCIHPQLSADPGIVERFRSEARLCAQLSHPNIVSVLDFGQRTESGELYTVMELVEGPSLEDLVGEGQTLELRRAVGIVEQLLLALDHAHSHGVAHRDVKPSNIILESTDVGVDRVKLLDFGIAHAEHTAAVGAEGLIVGTPEYMSPEQALGQSASFAADIYSTGVLLFQLLTGSLPFEAKTPMGVVHQHVLADRPDPCSRAPERCIPPALARVCMRAMSVAQEDRYASAWDFAKALETVRRAELGSRSGSMKRPSNPLRSVSVVPGARPDTSRFRQAEERVEKLMKAGNTQQALSVLVSALGAAQEAIRAGDTQQGAFALRTFGLRLGQLYVEVEQPKRAFTVLRSVLRLLPAGASGRAELLACLARIELMQRNFETAELLRYQAHQTALLEGDYELAQEMSVPFRLSGSSQDVSPASVSGSVARVASSTSQVPPTIAAPEAPRITISGDPPDGDLADTHVRRRTPRRQVG